MPGIGEFKDRHKDEPICILANGPTLLKGLPLLPEGMLTIGMNASFSHHRSPYWVGLDRSTLWQADTLGYDPDVVFLPTMEECDASEGHGGFIYEKAKEQVHINSIFGRMFKWSNDLEEVIYTCRATIWFVLQLAAYMGCDPIFMLGFDLKGPRPPGHIHAGEPMFEDGTFHQLQLMGYLRRLLETGEIGSRIYNCSPYSLCTSLPYHVPVDKNDWHPYGYQLEVKKR